MKKLALITLVLLSFSQVLSQTMAQQIQAGEPIEKPEVTYEYAQVFWSGTSWLFKSEKTNGIVLLETEGKRKGKGIKSTDLYLVLNILGRFGWKLEHNKTDRFYFIKEVQKNVN